MQQNMYIIRSKEQKQINNSNINFTKISFDAFGDNNYYTGWAKKTGPFLNVDNFATVSGRKACNMSKVCKFCLEKIIKLA